MNQKELIVTIKKHVFSYESFGLKEPLRISLYNGIKLDDVQIIINVMDYF